MSIHIDTVKRALEFKNPEYLPMEILDAPGVYNAYNTLDPGKATFIPGTEDFDSLWTNCYSWVHTEIGKTEKGESLRRDQFGTLLKIPEDENSTYVLLEHPLAGRNSMGNFTFPDPADTELRFDNLGKAIAERYADRFIDGFIDAGILLTTMMLFGEENFLMKVADNIGFVAEVYEGVMAYYKGIVLNYKRAGAHMITDIEDIGGTAGLLINPETWRQYFKPVLQRFFKFVHDQGLYTSLLIDGNSSQILSDIAEMDVDLFACVDMHTTGIKTVQEALKGKTCVKAAVDMQKTLPMGTPEEIAREARELVEAFHTHEGGFICEVVRWYRPSYEMENVLASVDAFNHYRGKNR